MAEPDEPVIPPEYKPRPKRLTFTSKRFPFPGYVAMEARYTNGVDQQFVVTIAAEKKQQQALTAFGKELRVWLRADRIEQREAKTSDDDTDKRLRSALKRLAGKKGVTGSRLAFTAEAKDLPGSEPGDSVVVYWRIDPTVAKGAAKTFTGPDVVIVAVVRGPNYPDSKVELSGLTYVPHSVTVGGTRTRDANGYVTVTGKAKSKFTLDAKEGDGRWVRFN